MASDFAFSSVAAALQEADRYYPVGDERHVYIVSCDAQPQSYQPMLDGYIDAAVTYDCWYHSKKAVEVICDILNGKDVEQVNLVGGRLVTPDTLADLENNWALDYSD